MNSNLLGLTRYASLPKSVRKRDTHLRSHIPQIFANTFSNSQLYRDPRVVPALLRQTAVDRLIELGAEVA